MFSNLIKVKSKHLSLTGSPGMPSCPLSPGGPYRKSKTVTMALTWYGRHN